MCSAQKSTGHKLWWHSFFISLILISLLAGSFPPPKTVSAADSFSDDFESGLGNWQTDSPSITTVSPPIGAKNGSKVLQMAYNGGDGITVEKNFSTPQTQGVLSIWFYDSGPDTPAGSVILVSDSNPDTIQRQVVMLGVNPQTPGYYYYRATRNQPNLGMSSRVPRSQGWHKFEIVVTPAGSYGRIDDNALNLLPSSGEVTSVNRNLTAFTKIQIGATWDQAGNYWWDNLQLQNLPAAPVPDDFENGLGNWEKSIATGYSNGVAIVSPPVGAQSGSRALQLTYNGGESVAATQLFASSQQGIVTVWFYDANPGTPGGAIIVVANAAGNQVVMLGVNPNYPDTYYYRAATNNASWGMSSGVPRRPGWRKFEIVVTPKGSYGKIDGNNLSYLPSKENGNATAVNPNLTSFTQITIASTWGVAGTYFFDDLKLQSLPSLPATVKERERYFVELFANEKEYYDDNIPDKKYLAKGSRALALALTGRTTEAQVLLNEISQNYSKWGPTINGLSTTIADKLGLASWIIWDRIDSDTKNRVRNVITAEANYWSDKTTLDMGNGCQPSGNTLTCYVWGTSGEQSAWVADFMALAARMFPGNSAATSWEGAAKTFAFHSFSKGETYNGITVRSIFDDFLMDEHGYHPHPQYAIATIGELGHAYLYYRKSGATQIPEEFSHNVVNVWNAHRPYVDFSRYLWNAAMVQTEPGRAAAYPDEAFSNRGGKDDWGADATWVNNAFAYVSSLTGQQNIISDLTAYEYYIQDYNGYPAVANFKNRVVWGDNMPSDWKYVLDAIVAERHAYSLLYNDASISLPQTDAFCSQAYLSTPSQNGSVVEFKRKLWESPSPIWECDNAQIPSGRQGPSLKITSISSVTNAEAYSRLIPVRAGKDYILSYWVKTADLEGVNVGRVALSGYNQSVQEADEINVNRIQTQQVADLLSSGDPLTGTWDWQERSFLFTPPPGTAYVRVRVGLGQAQGAVWFADLELKEATGFNFFLNSITPREGQILENTPFGLSVVTTLEGSRPWASQGVYLRVFEQSQGICLRVGESQTSCNNNSNLLRNTWQGRKDFTVNFPGLGRGIYTLTVQTIVRRQFLIFSWDDVRKSTTFNFGVPLLPSALPQNLLSNPGFETGNVSPWVGEKANLALIDGATSPADIHSGRWAARVTLGSQAPFYSIDNFPGEVPNPRVGDTYYGTVWVKGGGNSLGKGVRLVIREHDNATPQYRRLESPGSLVPLTDSWQQLSVSHTLTNTGMTNLDILVTQEGALGGESFLVDDFFLSRVSSQNLLSNPGFESGQTSPWTSWQGILARSNDKHSGSWASLVSYDYQPSRPGFLPGAYSIDNFPGETDNPQIGQVYYATAWVKGVGTSVGKPVKLSIREHDFVRVNDVPGEFVTLENGWRQISAYYKVTNIGMTKLDVYVLQVDAVVGDTFLTDDIALYRF